MKRQWWFQAVVASPSQNSGSMATLICSCSKFSRTAEILSFFIEATDLYLAIARVARILGLANWTSACLVEFHCWIADEWVSSLRLRHFVWKWGSPVFPPNSTGLSLDCHYRSWFFIVVPAQMAEFWGHLIQRRIVARGGSRTGKKHSMPWANCNVLKERQLRMVL